IPGKSGSEGGDAAEIRQKLSRAVIVANEFAPPERTDREDPFAVAPGDNIIVGKRPIAESNWSTGRAPEGCFHRPGPQIPPALSLAEKEQIASVWGPLRAANLRRQVPFSAMQELVESGCISVDLVDGAPLQFIKSAENYLLSVGR